MLSGGLVMHQLISSSVVGIGSLIDGSQNAVWPLALEDEFRRIMKNAITCLRLIMFLPRQSDLNAAPDYIMTFQLMTSRCFGEYTLFINGRLLNILPFLFKLCTYQC